MTHPLVRRYPESRILPIAVDSPVPVTQAASHKLTFIGVYNKCAKWLKTVWGTASTRDCFLAPLNAVRSIDGCEPSECSGRSS
jgi:hypothetical protein